MHPTNNKLVAANDKGILKHGRVTIPIHLEEAALLVPVVVADINETAGILGMKFLREADCSIAFSKGILHCGDHEWQMTPEGVGEQVQRVRVNLPEHLATWADHAGGQLSVQQKDQIQDLLLKHSQAFAMADGKVGRKYRFNSVRHTIDSGNAPSIKTPYRPLAFAKQAIIDENLDQMLENSVIESSNSLWSSPMVANKKDGSARFRSDLRRLNITKNDAYPLPNINNCLGLLSGTQVCNVRHGLRVLASGP